MLATAARGRLALIPTSTFGGSNPDAYVVLNDVAWNLVVRAMETYRKGRAMPTQRQAAAAIMSKVASLLAGIEPVL